MNWLDKFENETRENEGKEYIKLTGEQDINIDLTIEPMKKEVTGTDGVMRTYWNLITVDGKILSCTNYLFGVIRKELDVLKGTSSVSALVRIRKLVADKVSWMVVLKSHQ